jgi:hypothetical protein
MKAKVLNKIRTSTPWERARYVMPGEVVEAVPANNLPEDRLIKYWLKPTVDGTEWAQDAEGVYGVGAYAEDVEVLDPSDNQET